MDSGSTTGPPYRCRRRASRKDSATAGSTSGNLLYHGSAQPTVDEKVYAKLSSRMKDRFDIFGTLPDVIDDEWIDNEERLEQELRNYTDRQRRARTNAFDLRSAGDVVPKDERWELCEKVLARNDVKKRLSRGWGERERVEA